MPSPQAGGRTTMRLSSTHRTRAVGLDFDSDAGVEYARHWARKACGQMPPAAGVIRRALAVYLAHLAAPGTHPADESRALACAYAPMRRDHDHQQATQRRLAVAIATACMPPWAEVATDPQVRATLRAVEARADEAAARVLARMPWRRRPACTAANVGTPASEHCGPPLTPRSAP